MQFSHCLISNQCCFMHLSSWLGKTAGRCYCRNFQCFSLSKWHCVRWSQTGTEFSLYFFVFMNQMRIMTSVWQRLTCRSVRKMWTVLQWEPSEALCQSGKISLHTCIVLWSLQISKLQILVKLVRDKAFSFLLGQSVRKNSLSIKLLHLLNHVLFISNKLGILNSAIFTTLQYQSHLTYVSWENYIYKISFNNVAAGVRTVCNNRNELKMLMHY